jgi:protoporphyrinogen oxidase
MNALRGLGPWQGCRIFLSYLKWQLFPYRLEDTFEQWVTNRFGRRLFLTFFKTYTEKVWGIPCSELKAEWAAQRIKDLSLRSVLLQMYLKPRNAIRSLVEEFHYPTLGPGMMWRAVKARIESRGGAVTLDAEVIRILRTDKRIDGVVVSRAGRAEVIRGTDFLSSMPVSDFIRRLDPPPPAPVLAAAGKLRYRDFLTVCLIVNRPELFPDNWIYVHDPGVKVGRIQNFKNWSPAMVPDPARSSLGLEYFCTAGDELWTMPDRDLIELGKREVERLGLASAADVEDGCVFRMDKSYPVYDADYREVLATVREFVAGLENFQTIGRNGLHRYNNQDHAMLTGMLAVRNLVLGERNDLWSVSVDDVYQEEEIALEVSEELEQTLIRVFNKVDRFALGAAVGTVTGLALCLVTFSLAKAGSYDLIARAALLSQYFPGYSVTVGGSLAGLFYGLLVGFAAGWLFGFARNAALAFHLALAYGRSEKNFMQRLFDNF